MCGDIHKRQQITYKGIPIVMPSSLIQQNFGETVSNHGYLIWDVETKKFTEHNVANKYPFYQFRITSLEQLENGTEQATNL